MRALFVSFGWSFVLSCRFQISRCLHLLYVFSSNFRALDTDTACINRTLAHRRGLNSLLPCRHARCVKLAIGVQAAHSASMLTDCTNLLRGAIESGVCGRLDRSAPLALRLRVRAHALHCLSEPSITTEHHNRASHPSQNCPKE